MDTKFLEMQLASISDRFDRFDGHVDKLFDGISEIRVSMERLSVATQQQADKGVLLERIQARAQQRIIAIEKEIKDVRDVSAGIIEEVAPLRTHFESINTWINILIGVPRALKFLTMFFGLIIGGYGVFAIIKDSLSLLK